MAQINFELKELKTDTDLETLIRGIVNLSFDKENIFICQKRKYEGVDFSFTKRRKLQPINRKRYRKESIFSTDKRYKTFHVFSEHS